MKPPPYLSFRGTAVAAAVCITAVSLNACSGDDSAPPDNTTDDDGTGGDGGGGGAGDGGDGGRASGGSGSGGEVIGNAPTSLGLSDVLSVSERLAVGSSLATIVVEDPDPDDTHTVTIVGQSDEFAVEGDELVLVAALDYETTASHSLTLRATDDSGLTFDQSLTVDLTDEIEVANLDDAGAGSLRDVVATSPAGSTIYFDVTGTITLTSGYISVANDLHIEGPGAGDVRISGGDTQGIFMVEQTIRLELGGVTLSDGGAPLILSLPAAELAVSDSVLEDSTVTGFVPGACIQANGPVTLERSTIQRCFAYNAAGVALNGGPNIVRGTLFTDNATTGNSSGAMSISDGPEATLVENCTFFNNATTGPNRVGGAIGMFLSEGISGVVTFRHNTFVNNTTTGVGGAMYVSMGRTALLEGNLFAGNTGAANAPDDVRLVSGGAVISGGYNLLEDGASSGLANGTNGDVLGQSAGAESALGDHGGPTLTVALPAGSPAIDAIPAIPANACTVTVDQRGAARPFGTGCDVGALEAGAAPVR